MQLTGTLRALNPPRAEFDIDPGVWHEITVTGNPTVGQAGIIQTAEVAPAVFYATGDIRADHTATDGSWSGVIAADEPLPAERPSGEDLHAGDLVHRLDLAGHTTQVYVYVADGWREHQLAAITELHDMLGDVETVLAEVIDG